MPKRHQCNIYCLHRRPRLPRRFNAIELFSGAGGLSLGLEAAGFDVRVAVDIDADCQNTHELNFPNATFLRADVASIRGRDLLSHLPRNERDIDLLVAAPPCQGLSIQGRRDVEDPRNELFVSAIRVIREARPKYALIENVPGLATIDDGSFVETLRDEMIKSGYRFMAAELLAAQYGVPQMRWRMVFFGARNDMPMPAFPKPTHGRHRIGHFVPNRPIDFADMAQFLTTHDAIHDLPAVAPGTRIDHYSGHPRAPFQIAMRAGLRGELYNHYATNLSPINLRRISLLRPGDDWRDLPRHLLPPSMLRAQRKDHTRRFRRMTWNTVPRAIVTRFRDPKSGEYIHPAQDRTISIREAARIQSFPDYFAFTGSVTSQYLQVGNAVPPLMAREIGRCFVRALIGVRHETHLPQTRYAMAVSV